MKEYKKNPVLGIVLMIVPVFMFLAVNIIISSIVSMFYVPGIIAQAQIDGVPTAMLTDAQWLNAKLMETSCLGVSTLLTDGIVALISYFWWKKVRDKEVRVRNAFNLEKFGFLILVGLAIQGCLNLVMGFAFKILPQSIYESYTSLAEGLVGDGSTSVVMALAVVVAAPVCEDLMMRGLALNYGRRYIGTKAAVIISSVVFGLMHLTNVSLANFAGVMVQVVYATLIGVILALVAVRFKSVWASVFVHFIINGSGQLVALMEGSLEDATVFDVVFIGLGVASLVGVILMLKFGKVPSPEAETFGDMKEAALAAQAVGENAE